MEQIIFLIIALSLAVFSMYMKSKKLKNALPKEEDSDHLFQQDSIQYDSLESEIIFEPYNATKSSQNSDFRSKKNKKFKKLQNSETQHTNNNSSQIHSQFTDLESDVCLLEEFEGTELQKAFLYSEILQKVNK